MGHTLLSPCMSITIYILAPLCICECCFFNVIVEMKNIIRNVSHTMNKNKIEHLELSEGIRHNLMTHNIIIHILY